MEKILKLLEKDATFDTKTIATMLCLDEAEVAAAIEKYKKDGVIFGTKTLINWEKTDKEVVSAIIELKVTPQRGEGFDKIASDIYQYEEVSDLYLMSGAYDLCVKVEGKTMKEVALFVAEKLAPIDEVISTATHFVLKNYKVGGLIVDSKKEDIREVITL
ncbi:MAG: Lrp/AsnC family transcriptional regulator [Clostridia bacterium]|nr:Lrp/AsnC family transcriptional regulator [Clostridia bacterium]MBR6646168.1 Lrp/AsnC family transcriptional regulator [Clostridia bacterium]